MKQTRAQKNLREAVVVIDLTINCSREVKLTTVRREVFGLILKANVLILINM